MRKCFKKYIKKLETKNDDVTTVYSALSMPLD